MVTKTEYALMAGDTYISTRNPINQFPIPDGWSGKSHVVDPATGFEAISFSKGNEVVISYAGTEPSDWGDWIANINLGGLGAVTEQLKLAAKYYINALKANPDADITFTGHSLGGGLASLMAVYFNKVAVTFDQAPFRGAVGYLNAMFLKNYLENEFPTTDVSNANIQNWLLPLEGFVNAKYWFPDDQVPGGGYYQEDEALVNTILSNREQFVSNTSVQNEILSILFSSRIGIPSLSDPLEHGSNINSTTPLHTIDLHSQTLLVAFLESGGDQSQPLPNTFRDVTHKLPDLIPMIFSNYLYNYPTTSPNPENFIERLVRHEFGNAPGVASSDLMLTRFNNDLWKIAQDGGLTLQNFNIISTADYKDNNGFPRLPPPNIPINVQSVGNTLIAFAMQKYYTETNWNALPVLFSDVPGGIQFDRNDVASTLNDAKGYNIYFKDYITNNFTNNEQASINSILPNLRDWYVQAGSDGLNATDTLNRGAFMLGGEGNDNLSGGNQADLLIGNEGNNTLTGNNGNDVLIGGNGINVIGTLIGGEGIDTYFADGKDTITDSDGHGSITFNNVTLTGGIRVKGTDVYKSSDGRVFYQEQSNGDIAAYMSTPEGTEQLNIQSPNDPPSKDGSGTTTGKSGMNVPLETPDPPPDHKAQEKFADAQNYVPPLRDPLTFDLDKDGLETTGISITNPILFDHDGDGVKTATGWVKADDAFLAFDRNGNGSIDNGAELFGDSTPLSTGGKATDGFAALPDFDSNHDGKISSADTQFANLRLWRDLNQNGISNTGELFTLNQLGIASINITKQINSQVLPDGNRIADLGTYTRTDGSLGGLGETSMLGDIDLIENTFFRTFANPLDTTAVAHLPDMQGSGQIRDLQEAATLSPALAQLLTSFSADTTYSGQKAKLDSIIKAWAGTSTMKTTFTGAFDGHPLSVSFAGITNGNSEYQAWVEKLTTLERFNGQTFCSVPSGTQPVNISLAVEQLTLLQQSYDIIKESVYGSLAMQTRLKPFLDLIEFKTDSTGAYIDFAATKNALQAAINADAAAGMASLLDFEKFAGKELHDSGWDGTDLIISNLVSLPITPALQAVYDDYGARMPGAAGTDQNDFLLGNNLNNALDGKNGEDFLFGSGGNDTLNGGAGNDMLVGGAGNDVLNGGIAGGYGVGDDIYLFDIGSGQDTINDYDSTLGNVDKIQLGAGILPNDVSISRSGNSLVLRFATNTTDQITIPNWYSNPDYRIEQLSFANGTVWDQADLYNKGNLSFAPKVDYGIISAAYSVSADDFNGDGQVDLAITNGSGASPLSILLRNATNTDFEPGVDYPLSGNPFYTVHSGDFNSDGKTDLAIANLGSNTVSVMLRNNINSGFEPIVNYATGSLPNSVNVADFNNDGKLDLVTANDAGNSVSILLRNVTNTGFDTKVDYVTGTSPQSVSVGDFNNDGRPDVAVANYLSNTVSVLFRNATNTGFDPRVDYVTGINPFSVDTGDFNGDGKLDLAVANWASSTVSVLLRNVTNTDFDPKVDYAFMGASYPSLGVADFNNDGKDDLAVTTYGGTAVSVLLRNTTNTGFDTQVDYAIGVGNRSIGIADFNSDGKLDLSVGHYALSSTVSVLLNNSSTTPTLAVGTITTFAEQTPVIVANSITINDIDGDTDWNGGSLRVQITGNASANDSLLLPTANNGGIWLNTTNNVLMANTMAIGSANAAFVNGGAAWTLTFNSAATNALVQSTAQAIQFNNTSGSPSTADRTVTFTAIDKNTGYDTAVQTIKVTVTNQSPTLIAPLVNQAVQSGTLGWSYNTSASFSDADVSDNLSYSATLANGSPLPAWIQMGTTTGVLTGSPGLSDRGIYALNIIATDTHGSSVSAPLIVAATVFNAGKLLVSTAGNDSLAGTIANDTVTYAYATAPVTVSLATATQQNTIGAGLDTLTNIDNLIGSNFNDNLTGNAKINALDGGAGNDTLNGGAGADILIGGLGNDIFVVNDAGDVVIEYLNEGTDKINSSVTYTLSANVENLTLTGVLVVDGTGNDLDNVITGNSAANQLNGQAGNDLLNGGGGDDTLTGWSGADTMVGGLGNDTYFVENTGDVITENLNEGTDTVSSRLAYTLLVNVENLTLTGTSVINGTGNDLDNSITGNSAANQLNGQAGNDTLNGGGGDDTLIGWSGADIMIGGLGNDTYLVENVGDVVTENLNQGTDTVSSRLAYTLPANVENLILTGTAAVNGTGNGLANGMTGNSTANQLNGGAGNDTLDGGAGTNSLTGGVGNDIFKFTTKGHIDTITDFNVVNDTIQLENAVFTALTTTGTLAASQFKIGTQALDADDFIIYNNVTGALLYDTNGSGAGAAVQIATLSAGLAMTNADFVVI